MPRLSLFCRRPGVSFLALMSLLVGCVPDPVDWGDVAYRISQLGDPDTRSAIMSAGLPTIPGTVNPCIMSIRAAGDSGELFRTWWSVRADSSVILSMQRSENRGRSWDAAIEVESR